MEAKFKIVGRVSPRGCFINDTGKFAGVEVEAPNSRNKNVKQYVKAFQADVIDALRAVRPGDNITIAGTLDIDCLRNKAKEDVKVDGYSVWSTMLVADSVTVDGKMTAEENAKSNDLPF